MSELGDRMEPLSQYLESIFEKYTFKNVGRNEQQKIEAAYRRGIFDKYFKLKDPLPPPPSQVSSICEELVSVIFAPNDLIKADVGVFLEGRKILPKKGNATLYITELWVESIRFLDDIYLSLTSEEHLLLKKDFVKLSGVPKGRAAFFSWILFKLAEFMKNISPSIRPYVFVKISGEVSVPYSENSILMSLFNALFEVYVKKSEDLLREIFCELLTDSDPNSALLKWVKRDKSIRNDLIEIFRKNPKLILSSMRYNKLSNRLSDLMDMKLKIGLDEETISKGIQIWAEENLGEILACSDVQSDPSLVSRWSNLLGKELTEKIEKLSREFQTPLHKRNIPPISPENQTKYGKFRIIHDHSESYFASRLRESTTHQVLQKLVNEEWKEVLRVETYSYEWEPFEPKEYKYQGPELNPQIFVDEQQGWLYIEKTDGYLFYSKNYGIKWESAEDTKPYLYGKRLNYLKFFKIPIIGKDSPPKT
ncbi:MAG: hypothetical protein QXG44_08975 [Candidatus Jordarchaeaceae archaeon]